MNQIRTILLDVETENNLTTDEMIELCYRILQSNEDEFSNERDRLERHSGEHNVLFCEAIYKYKNDKKNEAFKLFSINASMGHLPSMVMQGFLLKILDENIEHGNIILSNCSQHPASKLIHNISDSLCKRLNGLVENFNLGFLFTICIKINEKSDFIFRCIETTNNYTFTAYEYECILYIIIEMCEKYEMDLFDLLPANNGFSYDIKDHIYRSIFMWSFVRNKNNAKLISQKIDYISANIKSDFYIDFNKNIEIETFLNRYIRNAEENAYDVLPNGLRASVFFESICQIIETSNWIKKYKKDVQLFIEDIFCKDVAQIIFIYSIPVNDKYSNVHID
jgi:hypothetical protein